MKRMIALTAVAACLIAATGSARGESAARIRAEKLFVEAQKELARGDDRAAESLLMESLDLDGSFTSAVWQLAQIYEKRGRLEHARELMIRGLQQEPGAGWAREKLARLEGILTRQLLVEAEDLMGRGEYERAIPKLSLYLGIKPFDPAPLVDMARCHLAMGNLETARGYLEQARERDPSGIETAALLEEIESRMGKAAVRSAVAGARKLLASYVPEDRARAEEALREVLALDPANGWAKEKLSELALLAEEEKGAKEIGAGGEGIAGKGVEAIREIEGPVSESVSRTLSFLRQRALLAVLAVIAVLLGLNLRRKSASRSYPLQGSLSLIPMLDIVSLINSNLKSGRLQLNSSSGRGEIFFEKGEVVHARLGSRDGKEAFHRIMSARSGRFVFYNHLPNIRHTISDPLSLLLLSMKTAREKPPEPERKANAERENIFT